MKSILVIVLLLPAALLPALSPEEIVRRLEENQIHETAYSEGRMITTDKYGSITRTFRSWARGDEEALIEFTSKGEEGQKILRTEDEIYLYFPDAEDVLRIQGSAMRDSIMDSDFSYEDMTGGKSLLDDYNTELEGNERVNGIDCYVIRLTAKSRSVPYHSQLLWIDSSRFTSLKGHKFSRSGTLLKEMEFDEITEIEGKYIPTQIVVRDKMKKDSSTRMILDTLELGITIDPRIFSLEELTW
jgi:outer membrane lipoprotein-sorting protein